MKPLRVLVGVCALTMFLTEDTVKSHIRGIFGKLGAENRAHAVSIAFRHHLIDGWSPQAGRVVEHERLVSAIERQLELIEKDARIRRLVGAGTRRHITVEFLVRGMLGAFEVRERRS